MLRRVLLVLHDAGTLAADKYALVITGASGGEEFAKRYDAWRTTMMSALTQKLGYPADHLIVLAEHQSDSVRKSDKENVERALPISAAGSAVTTCSSLS